MVHFCRPKKKQKVGEMFCCWPWSICFATLREAIFCIICRKASGTGKHVWLQRARHCLSGRGGSVSVEQAVSRAEQLEYSLMNVNGVPNSNLGIFYRLSFKCRKDRSEEGQKYSLIFEGNKILLQAFPQYLHTQFASQLIITPLLDCMQSPATFNHLAGGSPSFSQLSIWDLAQRNLP